MGAIVLETLKWRNYRIFSNCWKECGDFVVKRAPVYQKLEAQPVSSVSEHTHLELEVVNGNTKIETVFGLCFCSSSVSTNAMSPPQERSQRPSFFRNELE